MEIGTLNAKSPIPKENRSLNSSLLTFNLPVLIERMKHSQPWAEGELTAMILMKTRGKRIVLAVLHGGTEIDSFQSNDSVTLQIIEGKLEFYTRKESLILNRGQFLTLHEKMKYSLITSEETVFLLTIANGALKPAES
jgi:hypothetical protein